MFGGAPVRENVQRQTAVKTTLQFGFALVPDAVTLQCEVEIVTVPQDMNARLCCCS